MAAAARSNATEVMNRATVEEGRVPTTRAPNTVAPAAEAGPTAFNRGAGRSAGSDGPIDPSARAQATPSRLEGRPVPPVIPSQEINPASNAVLGGSNGRTHPSMAARATTHSGPGARRSKPVSGIQTNAPIDTAASATVAHRLRSLSRRARKAETANSAKPAARATTVAAGYAHAWPLRKRDGGTSASGMVMVAAAAAAAMVGNRGVRRVLAARSPAQAEAEATPAMAVAMSGSSIGPSVATVC